MCIHYTAVLASHVSKRKQKTATLMDDLTILWVRRLRMGSVFESILLYGNRGQNREKYEQGPYSFFFPVVHRVCTIVLW